MARARMGGRECEVRITRDLGDNNWSVEVAPRRAEPRKWELYKASPSVFLVKLHADSREAAAHAALGLLKQAKEIDDFTV